MSTEEQLQKFEQLYYQYSDAIFRHLYLRLGDRERALELSQDVFTRLWQQLAVGKTLEYEKAFLYRAAHNAFINEIRTDKRTKSLESMVEEDGFDIRDEETNSGDSAEHRELIEHLGRLKESYRVVLVMRYIDDLPITEIAKLLEESETNISMRLKRALEKLHATYEVRHHDE